MAEIKEALVPDIGDYSDIPVIEVLVAVGDTVKKDQGLVTLESDKATMEVPSSVAGVVKELKVKVGDNLSEGKVVALIEVAEGEAAKPAAGAPAPAKAAAPAAATQSAPAPAAAAPAASGGAVEALVPDIGDYTDIPVIEVLVAVGDTVKKDQGLVTLESDKATMEVPSSVAGVVKELKVKVGDNLSQGAVVAIIEAEGAAAPAPAKAAAAAAPAAAETATKVEPVAVPAQPDKLAAREIASAGTPSSPPVQFNADGVLPAKVPSSSRPRSAVACRPLPVLPLPPAVA
ncbi:hypothetical protein G6F57_017369 [Rhizopus arrhizus]|nr:hypothetical protein G6F57_017369 [Rhizopus arrhizus]